MQFKNLFVDFFANDIRDVYVYPTGYKAGSPGTIPANRIVLTKNSAIADRTLSVFKGEDLTLNIRPTSPMTEPYIYLDDALLPGDRVDQDSQSANFVVTFQFNDLKDNSVLTFSDSALVQATLESTGSRAPSPLGVAAAQKSKEIAVSFERLAANGAPYTAATTQLTITLSKAIGSLTSDDITVTGATKGTLTGAGPIYTLAVTGVAGQWQPITAVIVKSGFTFSPVSRTAAGNAPESAKIMPGETIDLSGAWKIAPGLERMPLVGGSSTIPAGNSQLSSETRNNNLQPAGKVPAQVPDAEARLKDCDTSNWIPISVPGSVLGGLIDNKVYDYLFTPNNAGETDVQFDDNRTRIPNDFSVPWWYSKDFELTANDAERFATLKFNAINYTGQVFVNGVPLSNKRNNITSYEELQNRSGTLVLNGESSQSNFWNQPSQTALGSNRESWDNNEGWPVHSVKKGPFTYTDHTGYSIPDASTASRGSWDDWHDGFQGGFRTYELDVTGLLKEGTNNIKVKVTRGDRNNDFNYNLHDWHMSPVDMMMGITYKVTLQFTGVVRLSNPFASFVVEKDLSSARANFFVDVNNFAGVPVRGTINAKIYGPNDPDMTGTPMKTFRTSVVVPANVYNYETVLPKQTFSGEELRLWWPYMSGGQPLYKVAYDFVPDSPTALPLFTDRFDSEKVGAASDLPSSDKINSKADRYTAVSPSNTLVHRFGIRQITGELNKYSSHRWGVMMQVYVNHRPIVVRGAGYTPTDLYMRQDTNTDRAVVDLVKSMGYNTFRDEGKFFNDNLFDIMDEEGIFLMPGYMCCDRHESDASLYAPVERFILYEHTYSLVRRMRTRPSFLSWNNGSDYTKDGGFSSSQGFPPSQASYNTAPKMFEIEGRLRMYEHALTIASGSGEGHGGSSTIIGNLSGLEMQHSYDSVVPTFYYSSIPPKDAAGSNGIVSGSTRGIYGFISEGAGGGGVPATESLRRFIPEENLWPYNLGHTGSGAGPGNYNKWNYHACRGGGSFAKIDVMVGYTDNAFGGADNIGEAVMQFNLYQYEKMRAIHEALSKHRYSTATGFINWMMNGIRPSVMWNQFDFFMNPHGSTYGTGKANEPVHIMYDPFNKEITVANYTFENVGNLTAEMTLYDIDANIITDTLKKTVNVVPDAIGQRAGPFQERVVGFSPTIRSGPGWYNEAEFVPVTYSYPAPGNNNSAKIDPAGNSGLQLVWGQTDIDGSLIRPTSDVYFMRLELKDASGKVVSYNTYAIPRRESVSSGTSVWQRGGGSQSMDWTQLKALPKVELQFHVGPHKSDSLYIEQTVEITNPTGSIAHGVEIKSYTDTSKTLLCPATYSDNLITLFPGQTRTITVRHQRSFLNVPTVTGVDCFNNVITNRPERIGNVYHPFSPIGQTNDGTSDSTPNATTNLARNREFSMTLSRGPYGAENNIGQPGALPLGLANRGTTLIESSLMSSTSISAGFRVDLGEVKPFDKIMCRWGNPSISSTNWMAGVPNYVTVEISCNSDADWIPAAVYNSRSGTEENFSATYDNTKARAMLTNITLKEPVAARYIRLIPTGLTTGSTVYGDGPGTIGSPSTYARPAASSFRINGLEVYNSYTYVYVKELPDGVKITADSRMLDKNTPAYVYVGKASMIHTDRYLKKYAGSDLELKIEMPPGYNIYLNGENISDKLEGKTLTLTSELVKGHAELNIKK